MEKRENQEKKQGRSVVVVDDEPIIIMNLTEMLEDNNYEVLGTASDGYEAIAVCSEKHPDLVLMDINLPELDGLTTAEYLLKNGFSETIIMITAYGETELIERATEIGVFGYVVKPIGEKQLISALNVAAARSREFRDLKQEVYESQKNMETRKKIERAKGLLMTQKKLSEQEAYSYIRNISKEYKISMEKVADIILVGDQRC